MPFRASVQSSLFQSHVIKEPVLEVIGEKLEDLTIDPNHAVVMASAHSVVESGTRRTGRLKTTSSATSDRVDHSPIRYRPATFDWPGPLIAVYVTIQHKIHVMRVVQDRQRPDSHIAA